MANFERLPAICQWRYMLKFKILLCHCSTCRLSSRFSISIEQFSFDFVTEVFSSAALCLFFISAMIVIFRTVFYILLQKQLIKILVQLSYRQIKQEKKEWSWYKHLPPGGSTDGSTDWSWPSGEWLGPFDSCNSLGFAVTELAAVVAGWPWLWYSAAASCCWRNFWLTACLLPKKMSYEI